MTQFTDEQVGRLFESNLAEAKASLSKLSFCSTETPNFKGLSGWVFEQTVVHCLGQELRSRGIHATFREQVSLGGRVTTDLLVGNLAIELKAAGVFHKSAAIRYGKYKNAAEKKGYSYLYLTLRETYHPYRQAMQVCLGNENAFFLDTRGDWRRLVERITQELRNAEAALQG
jgi:hypothetical protein